MGSFQKPNFNIPFGHLREEGGGQNLNFPTFVVNLSFWKKVKKEEKS